MSEKDRSLFTCGCIKYNVPCTARCKKHKHGYITYSRLVTVRVKEREKKEGRRRCLLTTNPDRIDYGKEYKTLVLSPNPTDMQAAWHFGMSSVVRNQIEPYAIMLHKKCVVYLIHPVGMKKMVKQLGKKYLPVKYRATIALEDTSKGSVYEVSVFGKSDLITDKDSTCASSFFREHLNPKHKLYMPYASCSAAVKATMLMPKFDLSTDNNSLFGSLVSRL